MRCWPLVVAMVCGCGHNGAKLDAGEADAFEFRDACTELSCFQYDCSTKGLPTTSVSGTVYAPNGTLALYGVDVYVPRSDPGPLAAGVQCMPCTASLQGGSYAQTRTDENGRFVLEDVPATANVPIVIQIGKWRRQLTVPNVAACQDHALPAAETTLPRNSSEGDLPLIGLSTGRYDSLECFLLKLGIDPAEIGTTGETRRVHLFANNGISGEGANQFAATHPGGARAFGASTTLWGTEAELSKYDIVVLSCEGDWYPTTKMQPAMDAVKAYADKGGRLFLSHWHNIWIEGTTAQKITPWTTISTWEHITDLPNPTVDFIDEVSNPKGSSFATWMENVGAAPVMRGQFPVTEGQRTCKTVDTTKAERWVYWTDGMAANERTQTFQFTTPIEMPTDSRCGKVVFSDMHVSAGSSSIPTTPYPGGCAMTGLTEQEKALAFMFFDISSCVGTIF